MVLQSGCASAYCQQQHEPGERGRGLVQRAQRTFGGRVVEELAVHRLCIGVGHDDVGREVLAICRAHPGDPAGVGLDGRHRCLQVDVDAALLAALEQGIGEAANAAT